MGLVMLALLFLPNWEGPLGGVLMVILYGGAGLVVILGLYRLMRVPEMEQLTHGATALLRRLRRK
jgi:hypothetical protein